MHAIVRVAGVQARVSAGDRVILPRLDIDAGESATFDEVLMLSDGDEVTIGAPTVEGASVEVQVLRHDRDKKVVVFKKKRRKRYTRKNGHRQRYTEVQVTDIVTGA